MKNQEYQPRYSSFYEFKQRIKAKKFGYRRIILNSILFIAATTSLAFHSQLYTSDLSVSFDVVNKETGSFYQYQKEDSPEVQKVKKKYVFLAGVVGHTNAGRFVSFKSTDYTYTGTSSWIDDSVVNGLAQWRIKFTTSGVFTPKKTVRIDVFLVGGGNGGRNSVKGQNQGGGGAGGKTGTWMNITLLAGNGYTITIGGGGASNGGTGGTTSISGSGISTMSKEGGTPHPTYFYGGGSGGSGGGRCGYPGGSDGANGQGTDAGTGQGSTTREFGLASGTLYSGAGGGGGFNGNGGAGGAGGGGNGGWGSYSSTVNPGDPGTNGLGGGGGGAAGNSSHAASGGVGGSGICVIRNKRS